MAGGQYVESCRKDYTCHKCGATILKGEIDKKKIICFDVETTGIHPDTDEIVQLSIVNGEGTVLFSDYIKPTYRKTWKRAEEIHGISPDMVKTKPTIEEHLPVLNEIFGNAELIVGYNSNSFDLKFIENAGVIVPKQTRKYDVMLEFAPIYGEWNDYHGDYKWQKLTTCANYYGYSFEAHDALEDVLATLHCFYCMIGEK